MKRRTQFPSPAPSWRYPQCAVPECFKEPRTYSRFCAVHAQRIYRTRDPRGRVLTKRELAPHRLIAEEFLERRKEHPAVIAAHEYMDGLLHSAGLAEDLQAHMRRLLVGGVTSREMLVTVVAVYSLEQSHPTALPSDRCRAMNLGRAVLGLRAFPRRYSHSGKARTEIPRGTFCEALGDRLAAHAGLFAVTFVQWVNSTIEKPLIAAEELREALKREPF